MQVKTVKIFTNQLRILPSNRTQKLNSLVGFEKLICENFDLVFQFLNQSEFRVFVLNWFVRYVGGFGGVG